MGSPAAGLAAGLAATWASGLAALLVEGLARGLAALGAGLAEGLTGCSAWNPCTALNSPLKSPRHTLSKRPQKKGHPSHPSWKQLRATFPSHKVLYEMAQAMNFAKILPSR